MRLTFDNKEDFLARLRELREQGHDSKSLRLHLPYALPEAEELLGTPKGPLRFFAIFGGLSGFLGGLAFTIYTALSWPMITGGKPIVSLPPFLLVAYILTILFGSLASFGGFLLLARLPDIETILSEEEEEDRFVIILEEEP